MNEIRRFRKNSINSRLCKLSFAAVLGCLGILTNSYATATGFYGSVSSFKGSVATSIIEQSDYADLAWHMGNGEVVLNGVTFLGTPASGSVTSNGITASLTSSREDRNVYRIMNRADSISDSGMKSLFETAAYMIGTGSPFDLNLSGLLTGKEYSLQLYFYDDSSSHRISITNADLGTLPLGNFYKNNGKSVVVTFTPDTDSITFSLSGTRPLLNAISLHSADHGRGGPAEAMGAGNIFDVQYQNTATNQAKLDALRNEYRSRIIRFGAWRYWRSGALNFTEMDVLYQDALDAARTPMILFAWAPSNNLNNSMGDYAKWYDIGSAYAARYPKVKYWSAFNEPTSWDKPANIGKATYPTKAEYREAFEGLADGIRSVDSDALIFPGAFKGNINSDFTSGGYLSSLADLMNDGTLSGFDLHIYRTDDDGLLNGKLPNRYSRSAQTLFDNHKASSGITADCLYFCSETNVRQLDANDRIIDFPSAAQEAHLAKRFFTALWDGLGVTKADGSSRASRFTLGWGMFGDEPSEEYISIEQLSPFIPKDRGIAYKNLSNWTAGTQWVSLDPKGSGVYVLENPGVRKVWVKQNLSGWTNDLSSTFTCTNISPLYSKIKVMAWNGRVRTVATNGASSVRITGLNTDETYLFLAQP